MIAHFDKSITITITTCRRLNYFKQTIEALKNNCKDLHKATRVIISDDNSASSDRLEMETKFRDFEFIWSNEGHAKSLHNLFRLVNTEYIFHLEDDRPMLRPMNLFSHCLEVMNKFEIDSFICGLNIGSKTDKTKSINNEKVYIHEFINDGRFYSDWDIGNTSWPGFYLAPGMHKTRSIISLPYLDKPQHERSFALAYQAAGYKVAFNSGTQIFGHLTEISAYNNITNARR